MLASLPAHLAVRSVLSCRSQLLIPQQIGTPLASFSSSHDAAGGHVYVLEENVSFAKCRPTKGLGHCDGRFHALYLSVLSAALLLHGLQLLPQDCDLALQVPDALLLSPVSVHFPVSVHLICCVVVIGRDSDHIILNVYEVAT